jgi:hypothetical protein
LAKSILQNENFKNEITYMGCLKTITHTAYSVDIAVIENTV